MSRNNLYGGRQYHNLHYQDDLETAQSNRNCNCSEMIGNLRRQVEQKKNQLEMLKIEHQKELINISMLEIQLKGAKQSLEELKNDQPLLIESEKRRNQLRCLLLQQKLKNDHKKEVDELKQKVENERNKKQQLAQNYLKIQTLNAGHIPVISNFQAQAEALKNHIKTLNAEHLQKEQNLLKWYQQQIKALNNRIKTLNAEHLRKEKQHQKQIQTLNAWHLQKEQSLQKQHQEQIKVLKAEHQSWKDQYSQLTQSYQSKQVQIFKQKEKKNCNIIKELIEENNKLCQGISDFSLQLDQTLKAFQIEKAIQISSLTKESQKTMNESKKLHQFQIKGFQIELQSRQKEIKKLSSTLQSQQQKIKELESKLQGEIKND